MAGAASAAGGTIDSVDGALAIEARFRVRVFRTMLLVTVGVHLLLLVQHGRWQSPMPWAVFVLALAVAAAVEAGPRRLWQRVAMPRHQAGVGLVGTLYTAYLGADVAATGAATDSPATWWMSVYPCYVILAGSLRTGLALLMGTLLWFAAVYIAAAQGWLQPRPTVPMETGLSLVAAIGSSAVLGLFLVFSVQRRFALRDALLSAIARLAAEREQARAEANAKALLLANTSHELRTPLNGVIGMAELLATSEHLAPAQQRELLGLMRQSAEMLRQLVDDVLDYSKLEAGRLETEHEPFALRSTVFGIADLFAPQAHGKGIEIGVCFTPDVPHRVVGDALRLRQVLANFVANAVKFTDRGGVQLCVSTLPQGWLRFEVHDSGIGIGEAALAALFKPYVQASAATPRLYGGSGLGLSICRQLAERLGGRVAARSTPGQGSVFSLELPLPESAGGASFSYPALPALDGVCLVTRNHYLHWAVEDMLRPRGVMVTQAQSLEDPLLAAPSARTVVVIDANVLAEGRSARALPALTQRLPTLPVVLHAMVSSEMPASVSGAGILLYKPVRLSRLLSALIQALEMPRGGAQPFALSGPAAGGAAPAPTPALPPPLAGLTVLLADDNPINQIIASTMLEQLGAQVRVAEGGEEALLALRQGGLDIALLDCEMPGLDGREVCRRWREVERREGLPRLPIVAVTGHSRRDAWPSCAGAGMDEFLGKPFFADQLAPLVLAQVSAAAAVDG